MEQNQTPQTTSFERIGNNVKVTVRPAGSPEPSAPAPTAGPVHRASGSTVRYNAMTGELSTSTPKTVNVTAPKAEAFALNAQGTAVALSEANASSVITIPGMGDSTAAAWVAAGMLKRAPNGQGYVLAGEAARAAAAEQEKPKAEQKPEAPANPADVAGVKGTSEESDAFQKALETNSAAYEGIVSSIGKGKLPDFAEVARIHGEDPETFAPRAAQLHGELITAGQRVLANVGVSNPEAFEAWATSQRPEQAGDAVRAMMNRDVSKLAALGREFAADHTNRIERKVISMGIDTKRGQDGTLYIARSAVGLAPTPKRGDFPSDHFISLKEAQRLNLVTINE